MSTCSRQNASNNNSNNHNTKNVKTNDKNNKNKDLIIPSMNQDLMAGLYGLRKNEEMCDITIMTQNNVKHEAHSVILAAASPVFKVMVTQEFKEFHSKIIKLPDIPEQTMDEILDFVYSGVIELNSDNVIDLFTYADRLELKALIYKCKEFIHTQLDVQNCLGVRRLGERYCHNDIIHSATIFILQLFQGFSETEEFLSLSLLEFIELLTHDELNIEKEEALLPIVLRWVDHDKTRKTHLQELLKCLRYTIMNTKTIQTNFSTLPLLKSKSMQKLGKSIISGCTDFENRTTNRKASSLDWMTTEHRIPPQVILLVGGWNRGRTLDICECYNRKSNQWYVTDHLRDPAGGRCYFGVEYINRFVYVIGGYDGKHYLNTARRFDPVTKEWTDIANMHIRRCFTTVVSNNGKIYAIAGFDGSRRLTSVERYSIPKNQWTLLKPLLLPRSDAAAVVHDGKVYVCGGYGGDSLCSCEVYDEERDIWRYITQMNSKRSGASAVSLPEQNKIIIMGGYNGVSRVKTVEFYDPVTETWAYGPAMLHSRSNFATCLIGRYLYVIGGYTGHATIPDVEKFDIIEENWTSISPLNVSRSAMKAVLLGNLPNTREYFEKGTQALDRARANPDFWARRFTDEQLNGQRRVLS